MKQACKDQKGTNRRKREKRYGRPVRRVVENSLLVNLLVGCRGGDAKLHGMVVGGRQAFNRFEAVTCSVAEAKVMEG